MDLTLKMTAEKLGKSLENLGEALEQELNTAVKNLAEAAYASLVAEVQSKRMDPKNRMDYLKGLQFADLGNNSYLIELTGEWASKLEDGFPAYDMKSVLLSSTKTVRVGPRAGKPWVKEGKNGKYAHIPFPHKPFAAQAGDLDAEIKQMKAFNRQGQLQKITKIFKDDFGKPLSGKVASIRNADHSFLQGLTKYQHIYESGAVQSLYMTFRTISENSTGWNHPGWSGWHFFDQAEKDVERELENIVNLLIK